MPPILRIDHFFDHSGLRPLFGTLGYIGVALIACPASLAKEEEPRLQTSYNLSRIPHLHDLQALFILHS